jgi:hypothetical protein
LKVGKVLPMTRQPTEALVRQGTDLILQYQRIEESKTAILRQLAEVVIDLRFNFDHDGHPDYGGRSWEYRQTVGRMYEAAGIPRDSQATIQSSLRYHVGNLLRERVTPEELAKAGLLTEGPKERVNHQRDLMQAAANVFSAEGDGRGRLDRVKVLASAVPIVESMVRDGLPTDAPLDEIHRILDRIEAAVLSIRLQVEDLQMRARQLSLDPYREDVTTS